MTAKLDLEQARANRLDHIRHCVACRTEQPCVVGHAYYELIREKEREQRDD